MIRENYGIAILNKSFPSKTFRFLGEGKSSVVFTDETLVYKVFLLENYEALGYKRNIFSTIQANISKFDNSNFFYPIQQIIEVNKDCYILIYPYEKSEPCTCFEQIEIQDFLVECWQKRIIFQDVKPENFIRVNGKLKWIDYEPDKFTDNLFLNMAVRAFIFAKYSSESQTFLNKLCRSAINNFDLPELQGFQHFSNTVFANIIFQESKIESQVTEDYISINNVSEIANKGFFKLPYQDNFNAEKVFWQLNKRNILLDKASFENAKLDNHNYFSPENIILKTQRIVEPKQKVSLVIKACVQDTEIIYEAVKHIVRQLTFPNVFDERILALDIRQTDFLREYNAKNTWEKLIEEAQKLVDDFVIDKFRRRLH
jgi:hypothetical protein